MARKMDIRKDVASRKPRIPPRIVWWIYRTVMHNVARKYNAHYEIVDDINKCKGPAFVIFNHLSRLDHIYVMEACYPRRLNIVAGYNEFFRSHLYRVFKLNKIIPKKNYCDNDLAGTKGMMAIINKGGVVAFSPEGLASNDGMNKPIVPKTGHLLKHFGVPVYYVEQHGQYLQNTKVCLDERYGETYARISVLLSPEDLERMSVEEIDAKINEAFRRDEYAWQKEKHIRWDMKGRPCERLDDMLFQCPRCKKRFTMKGEGDRITCLNCGNGASVDEYYDFHPFDESCVIPETQSEWVRRQRIDIIHEIRENPEYSYSEKVVIGRLPNDHLLTDMKTSEPVGEGILTIDHKGMHYVDDKNPSVNFDLDYKKLYTLVTELDSSYFDIYVNGEFTDVFPQERHSVLYINALVEEMHRLHENFYKNLPWNDYMYDENTKAWEDLEK